MFLVNVDFVDGHGLGHFPQASGGVGVPTGAVGRTVEGIDLVLEAPHALRGAHLYRVDLLERLHLSKGGAMGTRAGSMKTQAGGKQDKNSARCFFGGSTIEG